MILKNSNSFKKFKTIHFREFDKFFLLVSDISDSNFMYIFIIVINFLHVLWLVFKIFKTVTIF